MRILKHLVWWAIPLVGIQMIVDRSLVNPLINLYFSNGDLWAYAMAWIPWFIFLFTPYIGSLLIYYAILIPSVVKGTNQQRIKLFLYGAPLGSLGFGFMYNLLLKDVAHPIPWVTLPLFWGIPFGLIEGLRRYVNAIDKESNITRRWVNLVFWGLMNILLGVSFIAFLFM